MRLSKDSCKKSLSQDSLTLEELSSRLTGLVKGFATEEAAREYSRASIIGRRERHSLSASFTAVAAVRIMEEQANSARLARASESPADSGACSPTPLELAPFLGVKQGDGVTQGFWGARLTMTLLAMPMCPQAAGSWSARTARRSTSRRSTCLG